MSSRPLLWTLWPFKESPREFLTTLQVWNRRMYPRYSSFDLKPYSWAYLVYSPFSSVLQQSLYSFLNFYFMMSSVSSSLKVPSSPVVPIFDVSTTTSLFLLFQTSISGPFIPLPSRRHPERAVERLSVATSGVLVPWSFRRPEECQERMGRSPT